MTGTPLDRARIRHLATLLLLSLDGPDDESVAAYVRELVRAARLRPRPK